MSDITVSILTVKQRVLRLRMNTQLSFPRYECTPLVVIVVRVVTA